MIGAGLFERFPVDEIYGLHNVPGLPLGTVAVREGPLLAAEDNFEIELLGAGGHAAHPHETRDVIVAGAQLVLALQSIVARNLDPLEAAVVSVTEVLTDGARNVLPKRLVLRGDARAFRPEVQALVEGRLRALADSVAAGSGLAAKVAYTHEFAPTLNAPGPTRRALAAAESAGLQVIGDCAPRMGSDDFGVMLQHRPGAYALLGNGAEGEAGSAPLHSPVYDFNDAALAPGVAFFEALVRGEGAAS
jgi:hippurate hydrolase